MIPIKTLIVLAKENVTEEIIQQGDFSQLCEEHRTIIHLDETKSDEDFKNFLFDCTYHHYKNKHIYMIYLCYPNGRQISSVYIRAPNGKYTEDSSENIVSLPEHHGYIVIAVDTVPVYCMKKLVMDLMTLENSPQDIINPDDQTEPTDEDIKVTVIPNDNTVIPNDNGESVTNSSNETVAVAAINTISK
jgi:hypothetical protein